MIHTSTRRAHQDHSQLLSRSWLPIPDIPFHLLNLLRNLGEQVLEACEVALCWSHCVESFLLFARILAGCSGVRVSEHGHRSKKSLYGGVPLQEQ